MGVESDFGLPRELIFQLHNKNIYVLAQVRRKDCGVGNESYWYLASDLDLHDDAAVEWDHFILALNGVWIRLTEEEDALF